MSQTSFFIETQGKAFSCYESVIHYQSQPFLVEIQPARHHSNIENDCWY